jgi:hypothetical protein
MMARAAATPDGMVTRESYEQFLARGYSTMLRAYGPAAAQQFFTMMETTRQAGFQRGIGLALAALEAGDVEGAARAATAAQVFLPDGQQRRFVVQGGRVFMDSAPETPGGGVGAPVRQEIPREAMRNSLLMMMNPQWAATHLEQVRMNNATIADRAASRGLQARQLDLIEQERELARNAPPVFQLDHQARKGLDEALTEFAQTNPTYTPPANARPEVQAAARNANAELTRIASGILSANPGMTYNQAVQNAHAFLTSPNRHVAVNESLGVGLLLVPNPSGGAPLQVRVPRQLAEYFRRDSGSGPGAQGAQGAQSTRSARSPLPVAQQDPSIATPPATALPAPGAVAMGEPSLSNANARMQAALDALPRTSNVPDHVLVETARQFGIDPAALRERHAWIETQRQRAAQAVAPPDSTRDATRNAARDAVVVDRARRMAKDGALTVDQFGALAFQSGMSADRLAELLRREGIQPPRVGGAFGGLR